MTEAERIEEDAERLSSDWSPIKQKDGFYYGYIRGATAENSRLQQLIKEETSESKNPHEEAIKNLFYKCLQWEDGEIKGYDVQAVESLLPIIMRPLYEQTQALKAELKSAQELNRELKAELKTYLPEDCINGIERKFCHFRNGDGWKCKQCAE